MATIGNTYLTLADAYKQQGALKGTAAIIEMLAQYNPALADASVTECNSGHEHLTSVRTGLPEPTWRKLYQGVQPTKGTTAEVKDSTGMAEDWSEVDAKLVMMQKNPKKFRLIEAQAHLQGMSNNVEEYIWYGDQAERPETFTGLGPRFNQLTGAGTSDQIIDAGGIGSDNMSIWFVTWGEMHCQLLYPEGSKAGITREDKGLQTKEVGDGTVYDVFREKFCIDVGLTVRDYRGVARICNIDKSDLKADAATGANLIDLMIQAYYRLQNPGMSNGRTIIYCNRTIQEFLHKQAMNKANVELKLEQHAGKPVTTFLGLPIHRADSLLETEARIT